MDIIWMSIDNLYVIERDTKSHSKFVCRCICWKVSKYKWKFLRDISIFHECMFCVLDRKYKWFSGKIIYNWTLLEDPKRIPWKQWRYCNCKCNICWNIQENIRYENIRSGISKNCRKCWEDKSSLWMTNKRKQFIWNKYNSLTVLDVINNRDYKWWWKNMFKCLCDCWKIKEILARRVIKWEIKSCWCLVNRPSQHVNKIEDLLWMKNWHLTLVWEEDRLDRKQWVKKYIFSCNCWRWRQISCSLYDFKSWKVKSCWCIKSQKQIDMQEYIKWLWFDCIENYSEWDSKMQIDVYVPSLNIWFEFNWIIWHSLCFKEKFYHRDKKQYFHKIWINIVNIREDERDYKRSVVEWFIKSKLWIWKTIFAKNTEVKYMSHKDYIIFCEENHIQWRSQNVPITLWLYSWDEVIWVAWFTNKWEMVRYCIKIWNKIVWWFEKIISFFKKTYLWQDIITYANLDVVDIEKNVYERSWFTKWQLSFNSFFSDEKSYRIDKRKFKKIFWVKDNEITTELLQNIKYKECVGSGTQKYVLHTWNLI